MGEKDRHDTIAEPFTLSHYLRCACDAKVWAFAWLFGLTTTVSYAIAYFLPIILNDGMGFSVVASQCLISPPYVAAAIWMYTCAYFGDKYRLRAPFIVFNAIVGIVGLALLGFTENNGARYFGVFLATISANSNIPCILTYQANNIRGQWKRALASATLVGAGGIGGIVGHRFPPGGQAGIPAGNVRNDSGLVPSRRHHPPAFAQVPPCEQAGGGGREDYRGPRGVQVYSLNSHATEVEGMGFQMLAIRR